MVTVTDGDRARAKQALVEADYYGYYSKGEQQAARALQVLTEEFAAYGQEREEAGRRAERRQIASEVWDAFSALSVDGAALKWKPDVDYEDPREIQELINNVILFNVLSEQKGREQARPLTEEAKQYILDQWQKAELSEGQAASMLGVDRMGLRLMLREEYNPNYRTERARAIIARARGDS